MNVAGLNLKTLHDRAELKKSNHKKLVHRLKRKNSNELDEVIGHQHNALFEKVECLTCANCCKTSSPIILQNDIQRISKHLGTSAGNFMQNYIEMDEDGDFVFTKTPCPFLEPDNACSIYDVRPKACSQYPHTSQRKQVSILDVSIENVAVCPVVFRIFEHLEKSY